MPLKLRLTGAGEIQNYFEVSYIESATGESRVGRVLHTSGPPAILDAGSTLGDYKEMCEKNSLSIVLSRLLLF